MKKVAFLMLIFMMSFSTIQAQQKKSIDLNWKTDMNEAMKLAKSKNKHILIYFTGTDRSIPCKMLNNDFFYTEKFKKFADKHLVLVRVNSSRIPGLVNSYQQEKNIELSRKYDQRIHPTVVLTDANGKKIGAVESYNYLHDTSKYYELINKAVKN
jgi:thioredoxin-related protein